METLAVPSLPPGRLRLGSFDIFTVATFPIMLSCVFVCVCVCVRLQRDVQRLEKHDEVCSVVADREGRHSRPGCLAAEP